MARSRGVGAGIMDRQIEATAFGYPRERMF
jgi:hypothetical protein